MMPHRPSSNTQYSEFLQKESVDLFKAQLREWIEKNPAFASEEAAISALFSPNMIKMMLAIFIMHSPGFKVDVIQFSQIRMKDKEDEITFYAPLSYDIRRTPPKKNRGTLVSCTEDKETFTKAFKEYTAELLASLFKKLDTCVKNDEKKSKENFHDLFVGAFILTLKEGADFVDLVLNDFVPYLRKIITELETTEELTFNLLFNESDQEWTEFVTLYAEEKSLLNKRQLEILENDNISLDQKIQTLEESKKAKTLLHSYKTVLTPTEKKTISEHISSARGKIAYLESLDLEKRKELEGMLDNCILAAVNKYTSNIQDKHYRFKQRGDKRATELRTFLNNGKIIRMTILDKLKYIGLLYENHVPEKKSSFDLFRYKPGIKHNSLVAYLLEEFKQNDAVVGYINHILSQQDSNARLELNSSTDYRSKDSNIASERINAAQVLGRLSSKTLTLSWPDNTSLAPVVKPPVPQRHS